MATWEFTYQGLTFGGANDIGVRNIQGLGPPDTKLDEIVKAKEHGSWSYGDYLTSRTFTIDGDFRADDGSDFEGLADDWASAFGFPPGSPQPLGLNFPGKPQQRILCIPVRRQLDRNPLASIGFGLWSVQFLAEDPRIYAETASSLVGDGVATNAGIVPTYPTATIAGSTTNPKITNSTTGEFMEVTGTFAGGLLIDFAARTIYESTTSRYTNMDPDSIWWDLEPGDNDILFTGGGTLTLDWRSAWV